MKILTWTWRKFYNKKVILQNELLPWDILVQAVNLYGETIQKMLRNGWLIIILRLK